MQHGGGGGGRDAGGDDKTQDWVCAECGNTNYGWRHTCNRSVGVLAVWEGLVGGTCMPTGLQPAGLPHSVDRCIPLIS